MIHGKAVTNYMLKGAVGMCGEVCVCVLEGGQGVWV